MKEENYDYNSQQMPSQQMNQQSYDFNQPVVINNMAPGRTNNLAVSSLVLGIFALISCWIFFIPFVIGVIGLITGIISLVKKRPGSMMAIAGIILSAIGLLIGAALTFLIILGMLVS